MTVLSRRGVLILLGILMALQSAHARSRYGRRRDELRYKCWVLEDAEDRKCDGWQYWADDTPADVRNAIDPRDSKNHVIQLVRGKDVAYQFDVDARHADACIVQWRMWLEDTFYDYVECETSEGVLNIRYVPAPAQPGTVGREPVVPIDVPNRTHRWITVRRDVVNDLRTLYPKIKVISIRNLKFRGAGYIDDIRLYEYKDQDHDLLPDDFEERRKMDPQDPADAKARWVEKVIEMTESPDGTAQDDVTDEEEKPEAVQTEEPKKREKQESTMDKARRYRVALSDDERSEVWKYFEDCMAKRLSQVPKPQLGRVYRVRMRVGGEIVGRLEKFAEGRIALRTPHGLLVLPIHRVSRRDTLALFPREAARQMAMRDVQKKVDQLVGDKVVAAEKAGTETAAGETSTAAEAAALFGGAAPGDVQLGDADAGNAVGEGDDDAEVAAVQPAKPAPPVFRTEEVGRPVYNVRPAPTPDEIRPAMLAFGQWLKEQHRRVGGRIATRIYAKSQRGNAVLYLVVDPAFPKQDYDLRHRITVGMQQFWAFRCQGMGVADLSSSHLVLVTPQGKIVGGSRPEDPSDIWVSD